MEDALHSARIEAIAEAVSDRVAGAEYLAWRDEGQGYFYVDYVVRADGTVFDAFDVLGGDLCDDLGMELTWVTSHSSYEYGMLDLLTGESRWSKTPMVSEQGSRA